MRAKKILWLSLEAAVIVLAAASIAAGYILFPEGGIKSWGIFLGLAAVHLAETPVGLKIGGEKNLSMTRILIKTWLFGSTWWVPLKHGILDK